MLSFHFQSRDRPISPITRKTDRTDKFYCAVDSRIRSKTTHHRAHALVTTRLGRNLLTNAVERLSSKSSSSKSEYPSYIMSVEEEKQKFLNMPLEEKRSHYQINATTPDQLMSWCQYWKKNKATIVKDPVENIEKVDEALASKIFMWQGDITSLEIDAIVNAANSSLMGGGGVDGAIHRAAGPSLKKECATLNGCQVGNAKITGGYQLPAKYVIHTVGPRGEKPDELRECYENSLGRAVKNGVRTIAFPCISTGLYGYPQRQAAKIALSTVKAFLLENPDKIDKVIFCLFLKTDKDIYEELLQKYFGLD